MITEANSGHHGITLLGKSYQIPKHFGTKSWDQERINLIRESQ